jgi:hypothetical protein
MPYHVTHTVPGLELARAVRSLRQPMGATVEPTTVAGAIANVVGGTIYLAVTGVLGYYVGKWAGASPGWTAAGAALFGVPGTFASVGLTKGRKKE